MKTLLYSFFFLLLSFAFLTPQDMEANCRCFGTPLDLVIVMDRSGSMGQELKEVQAKLDKLIGVLKKHNPLVRVGMITYVNDSKMVDLTSDTSKIGGFLSKIRIGGGQELVDKALETALEKMSWRENSEKIIILIGDEPPNDYTDYQTGKAVRGDLRSYEMAERARKKGIVIHTLTTLDQPTFNWRKLTSAQLAEYRKLTEELRKFNRLRVTNPRLYQKKYQAWYNKVMAFYQRVSAYQNRGKGSQAKILPSFRTIAEKAGGKAFGLQNTSKLVEMLLYISTGLRYKLDSAKKVQNLRGTVIVIGQVSHEGDWNPPRSFSKALEAASQNLHIPVRDLPVVISLKDDELFQYPFLYMTGHKDPGFTQAQIDKLRKYLKRGGFLFADCCCGRKAFDEAFRRLANQLFPNSSLSPIPSQNKIYQNPFHLSEVEVATLPMDKGISFQKNYLEGLYYKGRLVIVYSSKCIGCGIGGEKSSNPCGIANHHAIKVFQNILYYALTE
ncbi:MAG: DUF4159 domain-containing protein [Planctomycetota bacterium]|nr:MAG: DUF4159 domain-containing protein [Planctomycetota bacterium]